MSAPWIPRLWVSAACVAAVVGCACNPPEDSGAPTPPTGDAQITSQGAVTCADPTLRVTQRFEVKLAPEQPLALAMLAGGGLVVADFTGDGLPDLFAPSESTYQFWTQTADGGFLEEEGPAFGATLMSMAVGGSAADYDGDGDLDLFVTRFDLPCMLFQNDGTGHFTDVTAVAGIGVKSAKWQSSSWADYDGDGDLDLVVGAYGPPPDDAQATEQVPGDPKALYQNNGDGTFTDRSDLLPSWVQEAYTFMTAWYDIDGDALPELFFVNDFAPYRHSVMLWNRGGTFEMADSEATGFQIGFFGMGFGVGDVNYDQQPDFLVSSWDEISLLESLQSETSIQWLEANQAAGLEAHPGLQRYGWGAELFDIDNDMDLDGVVGYGLWSQYPSNRPDQPDSLWLNDGSVPPLFTEVADLPEWGLDDRYITRGVAPVDLNHDGWMDLIKRELDFKTPLRIAHCGAEAWAEFELRMPSPNVFAVGSKIVVTAGGKTQTRWIQAGSSSMYTGLPPEAHFGLATAETIDAIDITWPDGVTSRFEGQASRQRYTITRAE